MNLNLIVAYDKNKLIGKNNRLPWRLRNDLNYFKKVTMGKTLIMGRKTYESLPVKLEGRKIVILTRDLEYNSKDEDVLVMNSLEEIINYIEINNNNKDFYVAGGVEIYKQFLPFINRLYVTEIDDEFDGDAYFPDWSKQDFKEVSREVNNESGLIHSFVLYDRV